MRLQDLGTYLIEGDRGAIHRLARSRASLPVGAILVLTASIARNHDGAWLPGEPQALTHGLLVSTVNAFLLYSLFFAMAMMNRLGRPRFWLGYTQFLALFWLTSPMAWLYAIPYEHMTHPKGAITLNTWTLALVSLWRVLIMARVMAVLWGSSMRVTLWPVLFFSDVVVLIGVFTMPAPIVNFMGGLQHVSPADAALVNMQFLVGFLGVLSLPVWFVAAMVSVAYFQGDWKLSKAEAEGNRWLPSRGVIAMLACVALVAGLLLANFQPDQARRHEATRLLREDFAAGFAYMSKFERSDFPPIWDAPPRLGYRETTPNAEAMRTVLAKDEGAPWARAIFLDKSWIMWINEARKPSWSFAEDPEEHLESLTRGYLDIARLDPIKLDSLLGGLRFHVEHDERLQANHRDEIRRWLDIIEQRERNEAKAAEESKSSPPTPTSPQPPPP